MSRRRGENAGWLVPIGGAENKDEDPEILRRFADICGGDHARIVVIPTASRLERTGPRYEKVFGELGVGHVRSLPFRDRSDCRREDWTEEIEKADGVFLTGGSQLRLARTLGGTPVARLLRHRHADGLHVAGTSAGASYMAEHMIAFGDPGATPRTHMVAMAPGLGLTDRFTIDQHFRERDRFGRLLTALAYNPYLVGLGLDENTAAFIRPDGTTEIVGTGSVTVVEGGDLEYASVGQEAGDPVCLVGVRMHILLRGAIYDPENRSVAPPPEGPEREVYET